MLQFRRVYFPKRFGVEFRAAEEAGGVSQIRGQSGFIAHERVLSVGAIGEGRNSHGRVKSLISQRGSNRV
jgi:hypothetical protein